MKKITLILLLMMAIASASAQVRFEDKSTDAVREMAIAAKKLVFIDLYASWCAPCRMMDRDVFSRKDVGEFVNKHFISAKYDTDKSVGKEMMKRYGGNSIPLYLVFDTKGELLGRITGSSPAKDFIENLQKILDKQVAKK